MDRNLFSEEHEQFRQSFKKFVQREIVPNQERWQERGIVDREAWRRAGEGGFLCLGSRPSTAAPVATFSARWS